MPDTQPTKLLTVEEIDMTQLWRLVNSDIGDSCQLIQLLGSIEYEVNNDNPNEERCLNFIESKHIDESIQYGRYYSSSSLITMKRDIRSFLAGSIYDELDIQASNPTLLYNLLKSTNINLHQLLFYITNRNEFHLRILDNTPNHIWTLIEDGKVMTPKRFINSYLNGSRTFWNSTLKYHANGVPGLLKLLNELNECMEYVWNHWPDVPYSANSPCPKGSKLSNMLLTLESRLISKVIETLHTRGLVDKIRNHYDCGYAYDGIFVRKRPDDMYLYVAIANEVAILQGLDHISFRLKRLENCDHIPAIAFVDRQIRVPSIAELGEHEKKLLIYPTGAGKTYQSVAYALEKYTTCLIIVHRRSLAVDIKRNYPQFECYIDGDGEFNRTTGADFQIICINSLDKLKFPAKYQCTIADEISSLLRQIVEMRTPKIIFKMFNVFIRKPNHEFIGMDALLCEQDKQLLNRITRFEDYSPDMASYPIKKCEVFNDTYWLKANLLQDILNGRRVCIAYSTSIDKMNGFLESTGISFINVNRNTKDKYSVTDWTEYNVVAFSPTMDAGVDVSFFDDCGNRFGYFDIVYGIFNRNTTTPKQAVQMLSRVRDCKEFRACITGSYTNTVFDNEKDFQRYVQSRLEFISKFDLIAQLNDDFVPELVKDFHYECVWNAVSHRCERTTKEFHKYFKYYIVRNRWKMYTAQSAQVNEEEKQSIKENERKGRLAEQREIALSPIISSSTYDMYKASNELSLPEFREYQAYRVNSAFGLDKQRPTKPFTESSNFGDIDLDAYRKWRQDIKEKQLRDLYPYDENGQCIGFDYLSEFKASSKRFYRFLQLLNIDEGGENSFEFYYNTVTFKEITTVIRTALKWLGFDKLNSTVDTASFKNIMDNRHFKDLLRRKKFYDYLREHTGLEIKYRDNAFVLVSTIASPDYSKPFTYFVPNSTIPFDGEDVSGFSPRGRKWQCNECFGLLTLSRVNNHTCPEPTQGYYFINNNGKRSMACLSCDRVVNRNRKRHKTSCS
jgi:hypothetical protein